MTVRDAVRTTALIAGKDLRVEWRSKVGLNQVLPFAAIVMVIFAFALDRFPNAPTPEGRREGSLLQTVAPGLVWLATLFSLLLLVQRTFSVESEDGALDALRAAGIDAGADVLGQDAGPRRPTGRPRGPAPRHRGRALRRRAAVVRDGVARSPPGSPLPSGWPRSVRSTAASLPVRGGGRRSSRCCSCRWWRPF